MLEFIGKIFVNLSVTPTYIPTFLMRKYQPIWEVIKKEHTARLAAPIGRHRQIILAVRKEKTGDTPWKYQNLEAGKRYKLMHKIDGKVITFSLAPATLISYATLTPNDL